MNIHIFHIYITFNVNKVDNVCIVTELNKYKQKNRKGTTVGKYTN